MIFFNLVETSLAGIFRVECFKFNQLLLTVLSHSVLKIIVKGNEINSHSSELKCLFLF